MSQGDDKEIKKDETTNGDSKLEPELIDFLKKNDIFHLSNYFEETGCVSIKRLSNKNKDDIKQMFALFDDVNPLDVERVINATVDLYGNDNQVFMRKVFGIEIPVKQLIDLIFKYANVYILSVCALRGDGLLSVVCAEKLRRRPIFEIELFPRDNVIIDGIKMTILGSRFDFTDCVMVRFRCVYDRETRTKLKILVISKGGRGYLTLDKIDKEMGEYTILLCNTGKKIRQIWGAIYAVVGLGQDKFSVLYCHSLSVGYRFSSFSTYVRFKSSGNELASDEMKHFREGRVIECPIDHQKSIDQSVTTTEKMSEIVGDIKDTDSDDSETRRIKIRLEILKLRTGSKHSDVVPR